MFVYSKFYKPMEALQIKLLEDWDWRFSRLSEPWYNYIILQIAAINHGCVQIATINHVLYYCCALGISRSAWHVENITNGNGEWRTFVKLFVAPNLNAAKRQCQLMDQSIDQGALYLSSVLEVISGLHSVCIWGLASIRIDLSLTVLN